MSSAVELLVVLTFAVVVPLWLILHYVTVWRRGQLARPRDGESAAADADELNRITERLERRLEAIETILDADAPGWREQK